MRRLNSPAASRSLLAIALLVLFGATFPATVQGSPVSPVQAEDATLLTLDPLDAEIDVGTTAGIDLYIEDVSGLFAFSLQLTFDPALLEADDADPTTDGVQIEPSSNLLDWGDVLTNTVDQEEGIIDFGWEASPDPIDIDADALLGTIVFVGKEDGTSFFVFSAAELRDQAGDPIDFTTEDGMITVTADETPTPTPEATSDVETPTHTPPADTTPVATATSLPSATPTSTSPGVQSRVMQVWPDRSIGIISGLLEDSTTHADNREFAFGVSEQPGEIVRARTYLHFPLGVFPPGTDVLSAKLYVYVDSSSGAGEATVGAYRVMAPWGETGWSDSPTTWPTLLDSPIAVAGIYFAETLSALLPPSTLAVPMPPKLAGPRLPVLANTAIGRRAPAPLDSPLSTPSSPLPTPTRTPTPSPQPGATPSGSAPIVMLEQVQGTWFVWDVTALVRAWLAGEVPDYGLALAPAPDPDAGPEAAGDLILARWLSADDPTTRPYLIADVDIYPVTPTPTPAPILPVAGASSDRAALGFILLAGAALLAMGLAIRRRN